MHFIPFRLFDIYCYIAIKLYKQVKKGIAINLYSFILIFIKSTTHNEDKMKPIDKLKEWLFKHKKTQKDLAESIGITKQTINNIINEHYKASDRVKYLIKEETGVEL